jgi:hypothetical protein
MENQQDLTQGQAVNVLIQAARIAQSKGAFSLEDAELVAKAIRVFVPVSQTQVDGDSVVNEEATDIAQNHLEKA